MENDEVRRPVCGPKAFVGVISDTHGLLRPEVYEAFRGMDLILHAGDIGNAEVLQLLRRLAPVVAVRGNNDLGTEKRNPQPGNGNMFLLVAVLRNFASNNTLSCHG